MAAGQPIINIDGYTYHAETYGNPEKPVVIAIHGGPGGDYRSILNLQQLSDEYFVVFFDQHGAGLSSRNSPDEITLASVVEPLTVPPEAEPGTTGFHLIIFRQCYFKE